MIVEVVLLCYWRDMMRLSDTSPDGPRQSKQEVRGKRM